ncbi:glutathione S-transferase-like protein [Chytriomyces sp. MP71]|nr:glutathione S-transferase-like protein [Chytriomyces sp. MP71]
MTELKHTLHVYNENYSSWSLRPLIVVRKLKLPVAVRVYNMEDPKHKVAVKAVNNTGVLPALEADFGDGQVAVIPDSFAVLEALNELFPRAGIWPNDVKNRSLARAVAAEMHSSYAPLRSAMPCNLRVRYPPQEWTAQVQKDITRILDLWNSLRARVVSDRNMEDHGWLFGNFSGADAMYFPIITRFLTYSVEIGDDFPLAREYMAHVLKDETVKDMYMIGQKEEWVVSHYDQVYDGMRIVEL